MAGAFQHYRLSLLGQDLTQTLDELINHDMFDSAHRDTVMEQFDKAFLDALATQVKGKATIKGVIKHYRHHDDIWTFFLESIEMRLDGKGINSNGKTQMIAVPKRSG